MKSDPDPRKLTMRIIIFGVLALTGFLIGLGLFHLSENFSSGVWMKLPRHPDKVAKLISVSSQYIVKTTTGDFYQHERWQEPSWIKIELPENPNYPIGFEQVCDFSSPEFSIFSNPPDDIVDCIQLKTLEADGSIMYTLALDANGDIWTSNITRTAYDTFNKLLCLPSLGLLFGMAAGAIVSYKLPGLQAKKLKN
jgi:hypothetical protein